MAELVSTDADDVELAQAGYRSQFLREIGAFAAFAAGFSYLSILTGVFQNFFVGYREAGASFVVTWPIVLFGQLLAALCFADLAGRFPFCGGIYAWSRRGGSRWVGWMTGWIYAASLVITLAAVALALNIVLPALSPVFRFTEDGPLNAALLGSGLILLSIILNVLGTRWTARVMSIGVILELFAGIALIILLFAKARRGPAEIVSAPLPGTAVGDWPLLAAAIVPAYVMYGFDTAGTLAEETVQPRRHSPRAILQALVAAGFLGLLLIVAALMAAPDLADPQLAADTGGLPYLVVAVLGDELGRFFLAMSVCAIIICTLAVHVTAVRVVFAMARDRVLPWSGLLSSVSERRRTPSAAVLMVGAGALALLVANCRFDKAMNALVCVCIVWTNLAYLMTVLQFMRRRPGEEPGMLGRFRTVVHGLTAVWSSLLIVNIGWPRSRFYGEEWYQQYGAILFTLVLVVVGVIVERANRRRPAESAP